jgi:hypothetical protein
MTVEYAITINVGVNEFIQKFVVKNDTVVTFDGEDYRFLDFDLNTMRITLGRLSSAHTFFSRASETVH